MAGRFSSQCVVLVGCWFWCLFDGWSMNKITVAVAVALFTAPVIIPKAHAISSSYRAQLERSGCTQETELNHSCDIHKTKAQNAAAARSVEAKERAKVQALLDDWVIDQSTDDAYDALENAGFTNPEPLKWVKGRYVVILSVNAKGQVYYATILK